jgi:hypothetical protein
LARFSCPTYCRLIRVVESVVHLSKKHESTHVAIHGSPICPLPSADLAMAFCCSRNMKVRSSTHKACNETRLADTLFTQKHQLVLLHLRWPIILNQFWRMICIGTPTYRIRDGKVGCSRRRHDDDEWDTTRICDAVRRLLEMGVSAMLLRVPRRLVWRSSAEYDELSSRCTR